MKDADCVGRHIYTTLSHAGFGPGLLSNVFQTPLPGFPGSPIHIVARNVTDNTTTVCWEDSASGSPFLSYKLQAVESGKERHFLFEHNANSVTSFPHISGCSKGVLVSELHGE